MSYPFTPDEAAEIVADLFADPAASRAALDELEARRRTWRYRLFASRWVREADRRLAGRLRDRLAAAERVKASGWRRADP